MSASVSVYIQFSSSAEKVIKNNKSQRPASHFFLCFASDLMGITPYQILALLALTSLAFGQFSVQILARNMSKYYGKCY